MNWWNILLSSVTIPVDKTAPFYETTTFHAFQAA
jgi:hypothetical protein